MDQSRALPLCPGLDALCHGIYWAVGGGTGLFSFACMGECIASERHLERERETTESPAGCRPESTIAKRHTHCHLSVPGSRKKKEKTPGPPPQTCPFTLHRQGVPDVKRATCAVAPLSTRVVGAPSFTSAGRPE